MTQPRLYIVTGKGGVGKTTIAQSLTQHLIDEGVDAFYSPFDQTPPDHELPTFYSTPEQSSEIYIQLKLNSPVVAKWIMKAPFFKSLFHVLPSLGQMILLGHIIKELEDNPNKVIVLDSPSSGHAKSMLSSLKNFKEIFKLGVLVQDIDRMMSFFHQPGNVKAIVTSIPTAMSLEEGKELNNFIKDFGISDSDFILNNYLETSFKEKEAPEFLIEKIKLEKEVLSNFENDIAHTLPQIFSKSHTEVLQKIHASVRTLA